MNNKRHSGRLLSENKSTRFASYNFPSWNYGCTLGSISDTGAYETYYDEGKKEKESPETQEIEQQQQQQTHVPEKETVPEKPIQDILRGRNPIVYCNEQSKIHGMNMEWNQVSESGPPHMKVFTWSLEIGDLSVEASANSKKGAKNKAAEEMARKLDFLPRPMKRTHQQMMMMGGGGYPPMMYSPYGMMDPSWNAKTRAPKKKKAKSSTKEEEAKPPNPSQDNPISQLYEYCKRIKSPEPIFNTICENALESRKTERGFFRKKVEFTLQVDVGGKKFEGVALTKKEAKYRAAEMAWKSIQENNRPKDESQQPQSAKA